MGGAVGSVDDASQKAADGDDDASPAVNERDQSVSRGGDEPEVVLPRTTPDANGATFASDANGAFNDAVAPLLPLPPVGQVPVSTAGPLGAAEWLQVTCPYLRSADGSWRSAVPQRGQRCWGQTPPAPLEVITQERLCRTSAHSQCEIYVAAETRRADALERDHVPAERLEGRFNVSVRPATLVLEDSTRRRFRLPSMPSPPSMTARATVAPVLNAGSSPTVRALVARVAISTPRRTRLGIGLVGVAVVGVVAVLAGLGGGATVVPTQPPPIAFVSPTPAASAPGPTSAASPAASASTSPGSSPTPVAPSLTPAPPSNPPGIKTTYRVHRNDTLAGIAAKFNVTRSQLRAVNHLGDPPRLRYGDVINIPFPKHG